MKSKNAEKYESLVNQIDEVPTQNKKLYHDLQAQLINIKGFTTEVSKSVSDIHSAMADIDMPPEFVEILRKITTNDLIPCLGYIDQSSDNLSEKLSEYLDNAE